MVAGKASTSRQISKSRRIRGLGRSFMSFSFFYLCLCLFLFDTIEAQPTNPDNSQQVQTGNFRPSIAVVIGVLSIMFSLTFLLLMYAKFCHITASELFRRNGDPHLDALPRSRFSGIDKTVIDSLPFFRFSSLKGWKEGLECAVCISKFDDTEMLRLLPKCKHAFHIECVDRWLENHSSCPLCRHKIDVNDITLFTYSNSLRFLRNPSMREDPNVELFVEREPDDTEGSSSRFSIGSSFRKSKKGKKEETPIAETTDDPQFLHKFNHKIIVSDVVFRNRWSDVNSSDLMFLNSEMLNVASSKRFSSFGSNSERFTSKMGGLPDIGSSSDDQISKIKEEMETKRLFESKVSRINRSQSVSVISELPSTSNFDVNSSNHSRLLIPSGKRSMSEITNLSRFVGFGLKNRSKANTAVSANAKEEKLRKLWLPIARRTVQWFAGRERRFNSQNQSATQDSNV